MKDRSSFACLPQRGAVLAAAGLLAASGAAFAAPAAADGTAKPSTASATAAPAGGGNAAVRDWRQVDTDGDGNVTPDEMERYLKANPGPLAPKR